MRGRPTVALILAAMTLAAWPAQSQTPATPRTADGHPDLSGFWGATGSPDVKVDSAGNVTYLFPARNGDFQNFTEDSEVVERLTNNIPQYKPQYWDKVQDLDYNGNDTDPSFACAPAGVPRMGAPAKIIQLPKETVFFNQGGFGHNEFRVIPTDGKPHNEERTREGTWLGDSVGHWDGDTFVVETIGFGDESWLDSEGYFHGFDLKVVERLRREGDKLTYDVTVEDPEMLTAPWVKSTRTMMLNNDPLALVGETPPCSERDREHLVDKVRG